MTLPKIGITMGDPTGIGPEIIVKALSMKEPFQVCRPIVFGDREVLSRAIQMQGLSTTVEIIERDSRRRISPSENLSLPFKPSWKSDSLRFGKPDRACGEAMVKYIEEAVKWVRSGRLDAITTCPINKQAMNAAGYPFPAIQNS